MMIIQMIKTLWMTATAIALIPTNSPTSTTCCHAFVVVTPQSTPNNRIHGISPTVSSIRLFSSVAKEQVQAKPKKKQQQQQQQQQHSKPKQQHQPKHHSVPLDQQIVRLGRQGKTQEALDLFYNKAAAQSLPTIRQVNAAIDACARCRPSSGGPRVETAFELLETYCRKINDKSNKKQNNNNNNNKNNNKNLLKPNVYTFGSLMNAISNAGQVNTAVELLQSMQDEYGVHPNSVVYNAAISATANANPPRPDIALHLLQQGGSMVTVNGYNSACAAAARAADWKLAARILNDMLLQQGGHDGCRRPPAPDHVTYGTVMAACEKCQEWNQVLLYMQQMRNNNLKEGEAQPLDMLALTSALHACQQLGLAEQAKEYLQLMKEISTTTTTTNTNNKNNNHNHWNQEEGGRPPLQGPDAVAYRLAISACARAGAWHDGIEILNEYLETDETTDAKTDVVAYTAAIHGCESAGQWKQAFLLLNRMRQNGAEPNEVTFAAVLGACATACARLTNHHHNQNQNIPALEETHHKMEDANTANASAATVAAKAVPLSEPQRKALQLLNVLRKDPTVPNPTIQVYNAAIRACAESMDVKRAFQLFDMLQHQDGLTPTIVTYGTLMTACERAGSIDDMDKVFQLMRQHNSNNNKKKNHDDNETPMEPNEIIYGAALSCCRKAGQAERAFLLLRKMLQDGLQPNVATFNTVLIAQTEMKQGNRAKALDRAMITFNTMQSKHNKYSSDSSSSNTSLSSPNRQSFNILIKACNQNKQPQQAEALLRQMKTEYGIIPDVDLFTNTITAYERNGQPIKALRLMESMREDGYDFYESSVLNDLFKNLVKLANTATTALVKHPTKNNNNSTTNINITTDKQLKQEEEVVADDKIAAISFSSKDIEKRLGRDML